MTKRALMTTGIKTAEMIKQEYVQSLQYELEDSLTITGSRYFFHANYGKWKVFGSVVDNSTFKSIYEQWENTFKSQWERHGWNVSTDIVRSDRDAGFHIIISKGNTNEV